MLFLLQIYIPHNCKGPAVVRECFFLHNHDQHGTLVTHEGYDDLQPLVLSPEKRGKIVRMYRRAQESTGGHGAVVDLRAADTKCGGVSAGRARRTAGAKKVR